jgi:hypothetical protein
MVPRSIVKELVPDNATAPPLNLAVEELMEVSVMLKELVPARLNAPPSDAEVAEMLLIDMFAWE